MENAVIIHGVHFAFTIMVSLHLSAAHQGPLMVILKTLGIVKRDERALFGSSPQPVETARGCARRWQWASIRLFGKVLAPMAMQAGRDFNVREETNSR
jgi:hypothetical protein